MSDITSRPPCSGCGRAEKDGHHPNCRIFGHPQTPEEATAESVEHAAWEERQRCTSCGAPFAYEFIPHSQSYACRRCGHGTSEYEGLVRLFGANVKETE